MQNRMMAGLLCLLLGGCVQPRGDLVAVPEDELEALRICMASTQSRELVVSQQDQVIQTLEALQESMALQAEQTRQQAAYLDTLMLGECGPGGRQNGTAGAGDGSTAEQTPPEYAGKLVVGAVENVLLPETGFIMPARVDTGANTSSMDARDIRNFERNGDEWVRFVLVDPETGDEAELERRRTRRVRIIQSTDDDGEVRPVVEMRITLGDLTQISEFTLTDRSHMRQPMLLGRNVLLDVMLVDVSSQNLVPLVLEDTDTPDEESVELDEGDARSVPDEDGEEE